MANREVTTETERRPECHGKSLHSVFFSMNVEGFSLHGNNPWEFSGNERTESSLNSLCTHFSLMSSVIVPLIKRQCVYVALSSWSARSTLVVNVAAMIMIAERFATMLWAKAIMKQLYGNTPMRTSKSEEQRREKREGEESVSVK